MVLLKLHALREDYTTLVLELVAKITSVELSIVSDVTLLPIGVEFNMGPILECNYQYIYGFRHVARTIAEYGDRNYYEKEHLYTPSLTSMQDSIIDNLYIFGTTLFDDNNINFLKFKLLLTELNRIALKYQFIGSQNLSLLDLMVVVMITVAMSKNIFSVSDCQNFSDLKRLICYLCNKKDIKQFLLKPHPKGTNKYSINFSKMISDASRNLDCTACLRDNTDCQPCNPDISTSPKSQDTTAPPESSENSMGLDDLKRLYQMVKIEGIDTRFNSFLSGGFSFKDYTPFYVRYDKLPTENRVDWMTSNQLTGFLDRMPKEFSKVSMGVFTISGNDGDYYISGLLLVKGQSMPESLATHPYIENYPYSKLNYEDSSELERIKELLFPQERPSVLGRPLVEVCLYLG